MIKKASVLVIIFFFFFINAFSQPAKDILRFAQEAFKDADYFSASYYYSKLMELEPDNFENAYLLAESSRLSYAYKDADKWYAFVEKSPSVNKYPLLKFYMGSVKKSLGNYDESLKYYNDFLYENKEANSDILRKTQQEIASCNKAIVLLKDTLKVRINRLENNINTPYSEFNPIPMGDSVLYFSSLRPLGKEKENALIQPSYNTIIYKSQLLLSGWSEPKEIDAKINSKDAHNANISFNNDKSIVYFSRCIESKGGKMQCAIFESHLQNNKWTNPEKLNPNINVSGYTTTQPAYGLNSDNQEALFFVSDRPGGQGGMDIWYSVIKNNIFNEPINLGSIINTPGDEISPFYHMPTGTLYYSSDWTEGMGGFDIFKSKGFFNNWNTQENLGYPINTSFNEIFFVLNDTLPEAYFSSNRPGSLHLKGETCCNDIYFVRFDEIKKDTIIISEEKDTVIITPKIQIEQLLPLTLYFHNDEPDPATTRTSTEQSYETTLKAYTMLKDIYIKEYSEGLSGMDKIKAQNDILDFFNQYVLNGFEKLKKFTAWLTEDLESGNTVQITIRGYCSPLNRGQYNINLSKRRISSLINYIRLFDNGRLLPYIEKTAPNGATLEIYEEPLGDVQAAPFVSNNPHDLRNSVYSRYAALERKVEIVMYNSGHDSTNFEFPELSFRNKQHDFGTLKNDEKKTHIFIFKNTGKAPLLLTSVETSSSAIITDWEAKEIPPAGTGVINILLDAKNIKGNITENIYVTANTNQGKIILEIKANIE